MDVLASQGFVKLMFFNTVYVPPLTNNKLVYDIIIEMNKDTFFYENPHDIQTAPNLKLTPKKII
jgi:hypothetical protein